MATGARARDGLTPAVVRHRGLYVRDFPVCFPCVDLAADSDGLWTHAADRAGGANLVHLGAGAIPARRHLAGHRPRLSHSSLRGHWIGMFRHTDPGTDDFP